MAAKKGEWQGLVEEYNLEDLYIFEDSEEVIFYPFDCRLLIYRP